MLYKDFEFTFGADPEIWAVKDGVPVSAHGLINGTKRRPFKVDGGAVQVDGMALEFNIDPACNPQEFKENINTVMGQLKGLLPDYDFEFNPVAMFGEDYIQSQPRIARALGCDPDFNAYTGKPNPRPNPYVPFRTASGHVHIGWTKLNDPDWPTSYPPRDEGHLSACSRLVKYLDAHLFLASLPFTNTKEEKLRRDLYGAPGAFRPKPYGVEYRSLSNTWLQKPEWIDFVFEGAWAAVENCFRFPTVTDPKYFNKSVPDLIEGVLGDNPECNEILENCFQLSYLKPPPGYVATKPKKKTKKKYNPYIAALEVQNLPNIDIREYVQQDEINYVRRMVGQRAPEPQQIMWNRIDEGVDRAGINHLFPREGDADRHPDGLAPAIPYPGGVQRINLPLREMGDPFMEDPFEPVEIYVEEDQFRPEGF